MPLAPVNSAFTRSLRMAAVAAFIPSIPLSIIHGVLSRHSVPAAGLAPQAASAALSALLLRLPLDSDADGEDDAEPELPWSGNVILEKLMHPLVVFALDTALAVALMVVLVITWVRHGLSPSMSMLAAYATIPLMTSFAVHLVLAVHALVHGLSIFSLMKWTAWRLVPPDCPNCNSRLRPELPELPWLKFFARRSGLGAYMPLLADDAAEPYRDDDEEAYCTPQPDAVDVRAKKGAKGKDTPAQSGDGAPWS